MWQCGKLSRRLRSLSEREGDGGGTFGTLFLASLVGSFVFALSPSGFLFLLVS